MKYFTLTLATVAGLSLTACGQSQSTNAGYKTPEKVTITKVSQDSAVETIEELPSTGDDRTARYTIGCDYFQIVNPETRSNFTSVVTVEKGRITSIDGASGRSVALIVNLSQGRITMHVPLAEKTIDVLAAIKKVDESKVIKFGLKSNEVSMTCVMSVLPTVAPTENPVKK